MGAFQIISRSVNSLAHLLSYDVTKKMSFRLLFEITFVNTASMLLYDRPYQLQRLRLATSVFMFTGCE